MIANIFELVLLAFLSPLDAILGGALSDDYEEERWPNRTIFIVMGPDGIERPVLHG